MDNIDTTLKKDGREMADRSKCMDEVLAGKVLTFQDVTEATMKTQIDKLTMDLSNKTQGMKGIFNKLKR